MGFCLRIPVLSVLKSICSNYPCPLSSGDILTEPHISQKVHTAVTPSSWSVGGMYVLKRFPRQSLPTAFKELPKDLR